MRKARKEVIDPTEVNVVHVHSRTVRRCFLFGDDPLTGKNFDHRKGWIEDLLEQFAGLFGIDILTFAVLSNHYHLVLRNRPDVVATWSDHEVARRWCMICPKRRNPDGTPQPPTEKEIDAIRLCGTQVAKVRSRLADVSWWMRLLNQRIATRSNKEDQGHGRFFEERFRATRLVDEASVLACSVYVDLNPIRAGIADTIESSDHTSIQRRIEGVRQAVRDEEASDSEPQHDKLAESDSEATADRPAIRVEPMRPRRDSMLSPVSLDEATGDVGPCAHEGGDRCSDKGFLPMSLADYCELLDWTARQPKEGKRGQTLESLPPVLSRLGLPAEAWQECVHDFGRLFSHVAGRPETIDALRSHHTHRRFHVRKRVRELLSAD